MTGRAGIVVKASTPVADSRKEYVRIILQKAVEQWKEYGRRQTNKAIPHCGRS